MSVIINGVDVQAPAQFTLRDLLEKNYFEIPSYQRKYAWDNQQIDELWSDFEDVFNDDKQIHFFGQIVTYKDVQGNRNELIDGQQRITTIFILFAVLRNISKKMQKEFYGKISDDLNFKLRELQSNIKRMLEDPNDNINMPKFVIQEYEESENDSKLQTFFNSLVYSDTSIAPDNAPMKLMKKSYDKLEILVRKLVNSEKNITSRVDKLLKIFTVFSEHFYIVMINSSQKKDAFSIFETLNSRGKDLNASDIIKSHLLSNTFDKNNSRTSISSWQSMAEVLSDDPVRITRFIRTYWASRYRLVSEKKLYKSIAENLEASESNKFLDELVDVVHEYGLLENPQLKKNKDIFDEPELNNYILVLKKIEFKTYYPLVLAMKIRMIRDANITKVIKKAVDIFIRARTIENLGTNFLETGFPVVAKKIYDSEITDVVDINNLLSEKMGKPNQEVKHSFAELKFEDPKKGSKKWTLVYLLSEIYDLMEDNFEQIFKEDKYMHVKIGVEDLNEDSGQKIGNWTLIEKHLASKLQNIKNINQRAEIIEKSELPQNRELARKMRGGWTDDDISERQKLLGDQAVTIWTE